MYARIPSKVLFATMFGEINGLETERVKKLTKLFKIAKLPYTINNDMK
ncbi:hypothetical protein BJV40_001178 [Clostridium beijerinckii]|nr:hypothetical protein [Clostridium beijerinckii]